MNKRRRANNLFPFFLLSIVLHGALIMLLAFGINFYSKKLPEERVIAFDILPVGKVNNLITKKVQKDESINNDNAKENKQTIPKEFKAVKDNIKKEIVKEEAQKPDLIATPTSASENNKSKVDKPEEVPLTSSNPKDKVEQKSQTSSQAKDRTEYTEPAKDKKIDTEVIKDKKDQKQAQPSAKKQENKKRSTTDKDLDSLLKNLEKSSTGNNATNLVNREKSKDQNNAFGKFDEELPESLTNYEVIRQQIMRKWNQPVASSTEAIVITLRITVDSDGTVTQANVIKMQCPIGKESVCYATRDSVRRAALNASPLENLNQSDYDEWREIDVHFDTRR